jgi:hypothetical protein
MITPVISDVRWLACQQFVVVIHADDANHLVLGGSDTVLGYGEITLAQMTQTQNSFQMRRDSVSTRRTSTSDSFSDQSSQVGRSVSQSVYYSQAVQNKHLSTTIPKNALR